MLAEPVACSVGRPVEISTYCGWKTTPFSSSPSAVSVDESKSTWSLPMRVTMMAKASGACVVVTA